MGNKEKYTQNVTKLKIPKPLPRFSLLKQFLYFFYFFSEAHVYNGYKPSMHPTKTVPGKRIL